MFGVVTGQDTQTIAFDEQTARAMAVGFKLPPDCVRPILYRPFDCRFVVYDPSVVTRPRTEVMRHLLAGENLGLIFMRQVALQEGYTHFGVTRVVVDNRSFYSNKGIMTGCRCTCIPTGS